MRTASFWNKLGHVARYFEHNLEKKKRPSRRGGLVSRRRPFFDVNVISTIY